MSVKELERQIRTLPARDLVRFSEWFDAFRGQAVPGKGSDGQPQREISREQKREVLRRRAAYLADPSTATLWEGTAERLLKKLRARRRQKALAGRS